MGDGGKLTEHLRRLEQSRQRTHVVLLRALKDHISYVAFRAPALDGHESRHGDGGQGWGVLLVRCLACWMGCRQGRAGALVA